jgi:acyl-CoA reductase-like NAD-dependent aldehyde dehydrogenase
MRMQLELGGKDPVYVCDDADLAHAAPSVAVGAFYNTGQSCCAVERVYVHERIHDAFVDAFLKDVRAFVVGDPMDEATFIGPVTRPAQLDVLEAQVEDARGKGARVRLGAGGAEGPGSYSSPTVLTDVDHRMELMREESFGPVIGIQKVKGDDEALALMNDTRYGLTAGVYSRDATGATRILSAVRSGSVYWNCCDRVSPRLPWSGAGTRGSGPPSVSTGSAPSCSRRPGTCARRARRVPALPWPGPRATVAGRGSSDFSWSVSRHDTFSSCRRKYFYSYYAR